MCNDFKHLSLYEVDPLLHRGGYINIPTPMIERKEMKLKETLIAWNPEGSVKVGPWPDTVRWSSNYFYTSGACWITVDNMTHTELGLFIYQLAMTMIIRDGVDPIFVHGELIKIDEYEERLPPELKGKGKKKK